MAGHAGGVGDKEVRRQGRSLVDARNAATNAGSNDATVSANARQHQERYFTSSHMSRRHWFATFCSWSSSASSSSSSSSSFIIIIIIIIIIIYFILFFIPRVV